jgi:hypothetical protein
VDEHVDDPAEHIVVIHGDARGADTVGDICAQLLDYELEVYPADWEKHGRSAGPIRNQQMLDAEPDVALFFHEDIANSRGTADMLERVKRAGIRYLLIEEGY